MKKTLLLLAAMSCAMALSAKDVWVLDSSYVIQSSPDTDPYTYRMDVYQYNEWAQPTQEITYFWSSDAGLLLPKYRYLYEYNDQHLECKYVSATFNGNKYVTSDVTKTTYNAMGQKDSVISYDPREAEHSLWVYRYDTHGNETGDNNYTKDTTLLDSKWELKYINIKDYVEIQGEYLLSNTEQLLADSAKVNRDAYEYNTSGKLTSRIYYSAKRSTDTWVNKELYLYTYDANNNQLSSTCQQWDNTKGEWKAPYSEEYMRYNNKNEMVYDSVTRDQKVLDNFQYDAQHRQIAYSWYTYDATTPRKLFCNYEYEYYAECGEITKEIIQSFNRLTGEASNLTTTIYVYRKIELPSGIEQVAGDRLQVAGSRKVLRDGHLYIIHNNKLFNLQGLEL